MYGVTFVQRQGFAIAADNLGCLPLARSKGLRTAAIIAKQTNDLKIPHDLKHIILAMPPMSATVAD